MASMACNAADQAEDLQLELAALRSVCAQAFQFADTVGAPARVLDVLAAAAQGAPLPHDGEFLPIAADECTELRAHRDALVYRIFAEHADKRGRFTQAAIEAATHELQSFDGSLASYLRKHAAYLGLAKDPVEGLRTLIDGWMATRQRRP